MNTDSSEHIIKRPVFDKHQRLTHWIIAAFVSFLLLSAWLIQHADIDVIAWSDWHSMVGQALLVVLAYRIFLMFRKGSGYWRLLIPTREQRHIIIDTLKFYLSLGRLNCPAWYAYNPVWQPLYVLMIGLLVIATLSGFMTGATLLGINMTWLHTISSQGILYLTLAHVIFAILHDSKGQGGQISAMLNGDKYFHAPGARQSNLELDVSDSTEQSVSLDSILKK